MRGNMEEMAKTQLKNWPNWHCRPLEYWNGGNRDRKQENKEDLDLCSYVREAGQDWREKRTEKNVLFSFIHFYFCFW